MSHEKSIANVKSAGLLIDPDELAQLVDSPAPPVIADCRFLLGDPGAGERAYAASHIPGAYYLHLDRDLSGPRAETGGRHPLPSAEAFGATLGRIGLSPGQLLVAYDDSRGAWAARLWWLARYFGHSEVCLLDGGWGLWSAQEMPVTNVVPVASHGRRVLRCADNVTIDFVALADETARRGLCLVDARDTPRYAGAEEPVDPVGGHIPGAINLPWSSACAQDGRFLDAEGQRARWAGVGAGPVVAYCGSGVTACVNLFSRAIAGFSGDRLYPGSWSDWSSRAGAPVATGPEPG
jgi:thiosulfate/3-mercaptopyruvate sulfurtransferase